MFQTLTVQEHSLSIKFFFVKSKGWPDGSPHPVKGFPSFTYRVSKMGISAFTRILQEKIDADTTGNYCCPITK